MGIEWSLNPLPRQGAHNASFNGRRATPQRLWQAPPARAANSTPGFAAGTTTYQQKVMLGKKVKLGVLMGLMGSIAHEQTRNGLRQEASAKRPANGL